MINYIALAVALALSAIAGYYSIAGLISIFSGAFIPVLIMGSVLECAKVITTAWLHRNWNICPKPIKIYLCSAVFVLMFITSMGIFGYLSKAHIQTNNQVEQSQLKVQPLEYQLKLEESRLRNAQTSLDTLDRFANTSNPKDAVFIRSLQKTERQRIYNQINDSAGKLEAINAKLLPLRVTQQAAEAEIGPLKYITELIYGKSDKTLLDKSVRYVIMILVLVFDPLALLLMISANIGFRNKPLPKPEEEKFTIKGNGGKIEIDKNGIMHM